MREYRKHHNGQPTKFWTKGFEILQNIQDRLTLEKGLKRARDPIALVTKCENNTTTGKGRRSSEDDDVPDVLQFCPESTK